jgi:peptidoglycan lytic transglycosylase G
LRTLFKLFVLALLAAAAWLGYGLLLPTTPQQETLVLLRPGWTTRHIATELKHQGLIRDINAFLLWHYVVRPKSLKAGEYKFDRAANAIEVHRRLALGDIYRHTVVIPEGFTMFDVADAIEAAGLGSRDDFLKAARANVSLVSDIDPEAKTLEGYLFPDTYQFTRTQSMGDMIAVMVRRFRQEARGIGLLNASNSQMPNGLDVHRLVTMASIVEKETAAPDERAMVASVYYNRLAKKMALDADPSVIYAALLDGDYRGTIYASNLRSRSPYNTYKFPGLPPGPIANPGRASLEAALHPAETQFLYFVSDNDGHHRFARTLDEHSRNVAKYRKALAAEKR